MNRDQDASGTLRSSALWGKRPNGDSRSSALWGKGGRGFALAVIASLVLAAPAFGGHDVKAYVPSDLYSAAQANPSATFDVIVQGDQGTNTASVAKGVRNAYHKFPGRGTGFKKRFASISGVDATLTGKQILKLATKNDILSITRNVKVALDGFSTTQIWPYAASVTGSWYDYSGSHPTIAVVDSGIDASRLDFAGRLLANVNLSTLPGNSAGDGRGHGTFVAGIAAGASAGYAGADPRAKLVSLDVIDDQGMARTSDVIGAADWILRNKDAYGIRVANFSLHASRANSFMFDPLDKAVEKLWFNGVVVVAAAGNYATAGQASGVPFAPGNDPFVITVGAADMHGTIRASDDTVAPWSAYGHTLDGFAKPELVAPGRFIIGPVPMSATLVADKPGNVVGPGYMQLSGTSFAAPIVAGAAAYILSKHPSWTPDQVKGALMVTARPISSTVPALAAGVGEANVSAAGQRDRVPNPNAALKSFLVADPSGAPGPVFDAASWANAAQASASWADASWADASWADASWATASWADASWADASWATASWADASWADASWADNADDDTVGSADAVLVDPSAAAAADASAGIDPSLDPVAAVAVATDATVTVSAP